MRTSDRGIGAHAATLSAKQKRLLSSLQERSILHSCGGLQAV